MAPFEVMYGYRPDFTIPPGPPTKFPALNSRLQTLREIRKKAEAALCMEKHTMKDAFELDKPPSHTFVPSQKVWLSSKDINTLHPSRKLTPRQLGPYEVLECTSNLTYRLQLPPSMHQHPVFHVNRLSPWCGNDINGMDPPPPAPIQVDDELEYEVEAVLDSHKYRNQFQYLVKWKGYDAGHNSWEPAAHLTNFTELVEAFHSTNPSVPRRISASSFPTFPWQACRTFTETPPCPFWELGISPLSPGRWP